MDTLVNSEDPDEMQHHAAFHLGLHCLLRLKQYSGTEIHHNLENITCDPFKYTVDSPILIVLICMGNPSEYNFRLKVIHLGTLVECITEK